MELVKEAKSTQEQAVAAWIDHLNVLRFNEIVRQLANQDINLENALSELQRLRLFIFSPEHILGRMATKHGEVAEHVQVRFSNAEAFVRGETATHSIDDVGRFAPEDYLRYGKMVQSKFYNGIKGTFSAIATHLKTYPFFLNEGGSYDVPKDQYDQLVDILHRGDTARSSLKRSEETLYKAIKEWEANNNVQFRDVVHPSVVNYKDVQLNVVDSTIDSEEADIVDTDHRIRDDIKRDNAPTAKEAIQVVAISAAIEGVVTFGLKVYEKKKAGKKLSDFTAEDWKDVGLDTSKGTVKGAVRGCTVYALTNFASTPAPVASALVTATFGVVALAAKYHNGDIDQDEFLESSEIVCLDVSVSAVSSMLGSALIPIPIFGAIIGNAAGMFMYNIALHYLDSTEQKIIHEYLLDIEKFDKEIEQEYSEFISLLDEKRDRFSSIVELCFDESINTRFAASISLAQYAGVEDSMILKNHDEGTAFFLS